MAAIKNSKAKAYATVEKEFKQRLNEVTIKGVAQGYIALANMIIDKINKGYSLEEVENFCKNIVKENDKK